SQAIFFVVRGNKNRFKTIKLMNATSPTIDASVINDMIFTPNTVIKINNYHIKCNRKKRNSILLINILINHSKAMYKSTICPLVGDATYKKKPTMLKMTANFNQRKMTAIHQI